MIFKGRFAIFLLSTSLLLNTKNTNGECMPVIVISDDKILSPGPDNLEYMIVPSGWSIHDEWNMSLTEIAFHDGESIIRSTDPERGILFQKNGPDRVSICEELISLWPGLWVLKHSI